MRRIQSFQEREFANEQQIAQEHVADEANQRVPHLLTVGRSPVRAKRPFHVGEEPPVRVHRGQPEELQSQSELFLGSLGSRPTICITWAL